MAQSNTYLDHVQMTLKAAAFLKLTGLSSSGPTKADAIDCRKILYSDSCLLSVVVRAVKDIQYNYNLDTELTEACDALIAEISRFETSGYVSSIFDRLATDVDFIAIKGVNVKGAIIPSSLKMLRIYQKISEKWGAVKVTRADVSGFNINTREFLEIDFAKIDVAASGLLQTGAAFTRSASNVDPSKFSNGIPTYTGVDMTVVATVGPLISAIDDIKTITYSVNRKVMQVYAGGRASRKGIARGHRTIAGTIICAVRLDDPLMKIHPAWMFGETPNVVNTDRDFWRETLLNDQLPMFDILIVFQNEQGHQSIMSIFGIQISDVGQVMSINDSMIEITFTYTAADVDILRFAATEEKNGVLTVKPYESQAYIERRRRVIYGTTVSSNPYANPRIYDKKYLTQTLKGIL